MTKHPGTNLRLFRNTLAVTVILGLTTLLASARAVAAEVADQAQSLRMVPSNAAFYSSSLRLREQYEAFRTSKAYSRLMEIPLIQLGKMQAMFQWQQSSDPRIARIREYIDSPEGQDAVAVLKEMASDEIFIYGGEDLAKAIRLIMELNGLQRTARLEAHASGEEAEDVMANRVRELLEKQAADFNVPTLVFGFRIKNAARAASQLDQVHALVRNLLDEHRPELSAHLQREQIAGHEYLTLQLEGSMLPWDKIEEKADGSDPEELKRWQELLRSKTISMALGVVENFVLLSVSQSTEHLGAIGQGATLTEQPGIKRLAKHAGERLASVDYFSNALASSLGSPQQTLDDLVGTADEILSQAEEVSEEQRMELLAQIRAFDIARFMPQAGETSGVVFLTARGYEGYKYDTGTKPMSDGSKPLSIVNHVGGSPLMMVASHSNDTVEDYDKLVSWLRGLARQIEKIAEQNTDADDWAKYQQYRARGLDLLRRVNKANREHFYPAFAENQGALVIDLAATSTRWIRQMPTSPKPLPMIEFGIVASLSDAEQLRQGVKEYAAVVRDAVALMREIDAEKFAKVHLQRPQKRGLADGGELYFYPLPKDWGLDDQIAPNAGLSNGAAALSTMPGTTERLLRATPLKIDTSLDLNRPAAQIVHFEFAKAVAAIRPWINYGLDVAMGNIKRDQDDDEDDDQEDPLQQSPMMLQMGFVVPQVQQLLDVASALRSMSAITYEEEGVWITHSETYLKDLK